MLNKSEGDEGISAYSWCELPLITHSLVVFLTRLKDFASFTLDCQDITAHGVFVFLPSTLHPIDLLTLR